MEQQWDEVEAKFDDVADNVLGHKIGKKDAEKYFNKFNVVKIMYDCYLCQKGLSCEKHKK